MRASAWWLKIARDIPTWFALLGPAGMPRNAVKVLSDNVAKAQTPKDVLDALMNQGVEPGYGSPSDTPMWSKLLKEAGIKPR